MGCKLDSGFTISARRFLRAHGYFFFFFFFWFFSEGGGKEQAAAAGRAFEHHREIADVLGPNNTAFSIKKKARQRRRTL